MTVADLEALETFIDAGATVNEAEHLAALFEFKAGARTYEGSLYRWMRATIADPNAVEELDDGRLVVTGTLEVIWRRHKDADHISVEVPQAILESYHVDPADYLDLPDELEDFWKAPAPLYHATTEDHVEDILEAGLQPRSTSRGLRNRGVGAAVFTTTDLETTAYGSYGDVVFEIDTAAMARDGYTPEVGLEPDVVEAAGKHALAWAFGIEDYAEEPENARDTVIVFGAIPPAYLRQLD
jgi:hypothetical protein